MTHELFRSKLDVRRVPLIAQLSSFARAALALTVRFVTLLCCLAFIMQLLETLGDPQGWDLAVRDEHEWTFFRSFYFTLVTVSTVGYGDFYPSTFLGRGYVGMIIVVGIAVFGLETEALVRLVLLQRAGEGRLHLDKRRFVVVTGETSASELADFIQGE